MNTIDLQLDAPYPGVTEMHGLVRSLGPTTLLDLFESHSVPEEDRFGLIEEALALLIVEGRREDDLSGRFLKILEARCRTQAGARATNEGDGDQAGFQLVGRVEYLCQASQEEVFHDPRRAVELAECAVELADLIDPQVCGETTAAEQRILAWAWLGNARRVASDLQGSENAFRESTRLIEETGAATTVRAQVFNLLGSLRTDQGRYPEARRMLTDALAVYQRLRAEPEQTSVRIKLANTYAEAGDPERAVMLLRRAVECLPKECDNQLRLLAHHNLIHWMIDARKPVEALARYEQVRPLYYELFQAPPLRMRHRWLEGRIYAALDDLDLARRGFEEARYIAIKHELLCDVALVSLELALIHLRLGQTHRVQELSNEMISFFRSRRLHRHLLAAMHLFHRAATTERATIGFLEEMRRYFEKSWKNPRVRFEPGEPSVGP